MKAKERIWESPRLLFFISLTSFIAILALMLMGYWGTQSLSLEILTIPILTLVFTFPIYLLLRLFPSELIDRIKSIRTNKLFNKWFKIIVGLGLLILICYVFGRILESQWRGMDDHEIMWFMGPESHLPLREIPSKLMLTEIGAYGSYPRFRPSYYFLRLIETSLWGKNPTLWYAARLGILSISILIGWSLTTPILGALGSALLWAYALTFSYWVGIIGQLGPSETYAILGLSLFILGVVRALRNDGKNKFTPYLSSFAITAGSLICIGSKEIFLLLVIPLVYLFILAVLKKNLSLLVSVTVGLMFAGLVASSVFIATRESGLDVYSNPISLSHRVEGILASLIEHKFINPIVVLMGVTVAVAGLYILPCLTRRKKMAIRSTIFWLLVLCSLYMGQWLFYFSNGWSSEVGRYNFPGLLYLPLSVLIFYKLYEELLFELRHRLPVDIAMKAALCLGLVGAIWLNGGYGENIRLLKGKVEETKIFTSRLENIVSILATNEESTIVVESGDVWDYEKIFGYPRFLAAFKITNPLYLRVDGYGPETFNPGRARKLATKVEEVSKYGDEYYSPLGQLDPNSELCFSLFLSIRYPTSCRSLD